MLRSTATGGLTLASWKRGGRPRAEDRARFAHPEARLRAGMWMEAHGAHAAVDLSDGLAGDIAHLAAASSVRCVLRLEDLPCAAGVSVPDALASFGLREDDFSVTFGSSHVAPPTPPGILCRSSLT